MPTTLSNPCQNLTVCASPLHARHVLPSWHEMALFSVCHGKAQRSTVGAGDKKETIAGCPCTPLWNLETFSETICGSSGSGKEIAGLKKKIW